MFKIFIYITLFFSLFTFSQNTIKGKVTAKNEALAFTNIYINELNKGVETNENGLYEFIDIPNGSYTITASYIGFKPEKKKEEKKQIYINKYFKHCKIKFRQN